MNRLGLQLGFAGIAMVACFSLLSCERSFFPTLEIATSSRVYIAAFSPNGEKLAGGLNTNSIQIWNSESGQTITELNGHHTQKLLSLAWSPDGNELSSTAGDNKAVIWDFVGNTQKELIHGGNPKGDIDAAVFSSDGRFLATRWDNVVVYVWNAQTGQLLNRHYTASPPVFTKDGNALLLIDLLYTNSGTYLRNNDVILWDFVTNQETPFHAHSDVAVTTFSDDNTRVLAVEKQTSTPMLDTWDLSTQTLLQSVSLLPYPADKNVELTYEFSQDGKRLLLNWSSTSVYVSVDMIGSIWDVAAGAEITQLHKPSVYSKLYFANREGTLLLSFINNLTSLNTQLSYLWSGTTGQPLAIIGGHRTDNGLPQFEGNILTHTWAWAPTGATLMSSTTLASQETVLCYDLSGIGP